MGLTAFLPQIALVMQNVIRAGDVESVPKLKPWNRFKKNGSPECADPVIGQTPVCECGWAAGSAACFVPPTVSVRLFCAVFPGVHAQSRHGVH
jgi:hypothetical protein